MIIQALNDDHASAFQALRLFGLRESPTSFGSSYEEEHSRTDQQILTHLVGSLERKFLGCFNDTGLVGVVGVGREQSVKERHIAFVRSMYVMPTARRQAVGLKLMLNAIGKANDVSDDVKRRTYAEINCFSTLAAFAADRAVAHGG
jgi:GNAT superfamily N-acetyltransferase